MKIQEIKSNQQSKYEEIIEYLKQDDGYWLENDKWDLTEEFFIGRKIYDSRYIDFSYFKNQYIKNEVKYYMLISFKNKYISNSRLLNVSFIFSHLAKFIQVHYKDIKYFYNINNKNTLLLKWKDFLLSSNIATTTTSIIYSPVLSSLYDFIINFYDDREETEKDIWDCSKINGIKISGTGYKNGGNRRLMFSHMPLYYRESVKKYFRTIITKKSVSHCINILTTLDSFFKTFYEMGYTDKFLENLSREDVEKYVYTIMNKYKGKNVTYLNKFISYPRTFLEYIQMAQYKEAPKKEVSFLIFENDIPKREKDNHRLQRIKFIPEPILKQLDNNIMDLDRPQYIPIYILLRETGWRGTDILNLRYHNCLEQIWNNKEQTYNYYLCGEITKTGIAQLKIPIRDKV